jgi:hypothetical protein
MAANLTKSSNIRLADVHAPIRLTALAGETVADGSPVYLHTDGKFYKAVSSACTISNVSKFDGVCVKGAASGEPLTAFGIGTKIYIADSGLTIGSFWFVSATAGALYDTAVASADTYLPVAEAISATTIEIVRGGI